MKEALLVIAVPLVLYLAYRAIYDLDNYDKMYGIPKGKKATLRIISILIPILGFILTRKYVIPKQST